MRSTLTVILFAFAATFTGCSTLYKEQPGAPVPLVADSVMNQAGAIVPIHELSPEEQALVTTAHIIPAGTPVPGPATFVENPIVKDVLAISTVIPGIEAISASLLTLFGLGAGFLNHKRQRTQKSLEAVVSGVNEFRKDLNEIEGLEKLDDKLIGTLQKHQAKLGVAVDVAKVVAKYGSPKARRTVSIPVEIIDALRASVK
jgi:hypothetical protein